MRDTDTPRAGHHGADRQVEVLVPLPPPRQRFYGEILFAFGLVLAVIFVRQTVFILKPFVLALLLGLALEPPVERLAKRGVNRYLAAIAVVIAAALVLTLLVVLMAPIVTDQVQLLVAQGPDLVRRAIAALQGLAGRFPAIGERLSGQLALGPLLGQVGDVFPLLGQLFGKLTRLAIDTILVLFLLVFGLGQPQPIRRLLAHAVPTRFAAPAERVVGVVVPQLRAWVVGLAIAMGSIGLLTLVGLLVLGVPYAFAFAMLAGLLEVVPFVGPILSAILPAIVTAADDPTKALYVILLFLGIQQFENHVLIPLVMSRTLAIHPVLIAFLLLVMTYYLGAFGTFIAVPTAVVVLALYQEAYLPWAHPEGLPPA